jgi:regulatory protein
VSRKTVEIGPALLEEWALSYLARFASSEEALRRVLLRRARRHCRDDTASLGRISLDIEGLLSRYRDRGLLDDAVYAESRARSLWRRGASLPAIAHALRAKGIERALVQGSLERLRTENADPDLAAACAFARRRRLGPFRRAAADPVRERRSFARAGFDRRTTEAVLACRDPAEVDQLLSGAET